MFRAILTRKVLLIVPALFLVACGGGGGGGGSDDGNRGGSGATIGYSQSFNTYMPLTEDTSINYQDGTSGVVAYNTGLSSSNEDIYDITYGEDDEALTLSFKSTPSNIELHAISGDFEASDARISKLVFHDPVIIYDGSNDTYAPTQATASLTYSGIPLMATVDVSFAKLEFNDVFSDTFGDGDLPVKLISLETRIQYDRYFLPIDTQVTIDQTLYTTLRLAKGIGIVQHIGNYAGMNLNAIISSLTSLPQPIWFEHNMLNPIPVSADTTFRIPSQVAPVNSTVYQLVNQEEINELGWVTVAEDTSSDTFNVTMQYDESLPDVSELPASIEVVFERISDKRRLSGNITLLP